jgi:hypothetical protein
VLSYFIKAQDCAHTTPWQFFSFSIKNFKNFILFIFTGVAYPGGKIAFIQALGNSSSDDDSIWAMDAVGCNPTATN